MNLLNLRRKEKHELTDFFWNSIAPGIDAEALNQDIYEYHEIEIDSGTQFELRVSIDEDGQYEVLARELHEIDDDVFEVDHTAGYWLVDPLPIDMTDDIPLDGTSDENGGEAYDDGESYEDGETYYDVEIDGDGVDHE